MIIKILEGPVQVGQLHWKTEPTKPVCCSVAAIHEFRQYANCDTGVAEYYLKKHNGNCDAAKNDYWRNVILVCDYD